MSKTDFVYPLPLKFLHERYDPIFLKINKGLSSTLIGLPLSSRSAYLKFILSSENILKKFCDPTKNSFIFVEGEHKDTLELVKEVGLKISDGKVISDSDRKTIREAISMNDSLIIEYAISQAIKNLRSGTKIVLVLYEAEKILYKNKEAGEFLYSIWNVSRTPPASKLVFCIIGSPMLLEIPESDFGKIKQAIHENITYFELFSEEEMEYTRKRLTYFRNNPISDNIHEISKRLSAGHYLIYKTLSGLSFNDIKDIQKHQSGKAIDVIINTVWTGIPASWKNSWNNKLLKIFRPLNEFTLLPPKNAHKENMSENILQLTSQEHILFKLFEKNADSIIDRDLFGQTLWGGNWTEKYSDWAIDKLVSNLRKKLIYSKYRILTLRNRGYKLVTN